MENLTQGKEIERLGLEYANSTESIDEFDNYLEENLDFPVTIIKQKFATYTTYNVHYEVKPGDVRVFSTSIIKTIKE
jgi:hypothetical protein